MEGGASRVWAVVESGTECAATAPAVSPKSCNTTWENWRCAARSGFPPPLTVSLTPLTDGSEAHRDRHGGGAPDELKRRTAVQDRHRSSSPSPSWGGAGRQRRLHAARLDALRQHWIASCRRRVSRTNSGRARRANCRFLRQAPRRRRLVEGGRGGVRLAGRALRDDGRHR